MKWHKTSISPQYIVGTTKLIGVGYTFIKARRMVQLDPEWMVRGEEQARKRINRITQLRQTHTYALIAEDSDVEKIIHDRQERRSYMIELALDPANVRDDNIARGIGDDENDLDDPPDNEADPNETLGDDVEMLN